MTEPDFAMGTSLVAGTARGFAPLPAFLLGAEAVPLLWVGDGKVASPSLEGGQVAVLRPHATVSWPRNDCTILAELGERITQLQYLLQLSLRTSENSVQAKFAELRIEVRRTSQNTPSRHSGE